LAETTSHFQPFRSSTGKGKQRRTAENSHSSTPEPPPVCVTGVRNISPMRQLLEQIAGEQYEIKFLAENQVKIQLKTSECYGTIVKALAENCTEFRTYKLKKK
jgi:hypothetical protein